MALKAEIIGFVYLLYKCIYENVCLYAYILFQELNLTTRVKVKKKEKKEGFILNVTCILK